MSENVTTTNNAGTAKDGSPASLPLGKIICGDNCEVMRTMPSESIDLVVTSPPYDDLRTYGGHDWDFYGVAWNLKRLIKPGGVIVWVVADATVNGSETGTSMRQALHFKEVGLNLHDTMIYRKTNGGANGSNKCYLACWEYAFVFSKGTPKALNLIRDRKNVTPPRRQEEAQGRRTVNGETKGRRVIERHEYGLRWNVWDYAVGGGCCGDAVALNHPAIFPEALARDHVLSWSNEGDIVLDPFNGSGTTTKMARELGRRYIGIDVNEEYCEIARKRLEQQLLPFEAASVSDG